jgi:acyl carrier protein
MNKIEINKIEELVIKSLKELIEVLDIRVNEPLNADTKLFGKKGFLDSMTLVSLIVDIEERIRNEYGVYLVLADERAMSQEKSPFRNVSSLAQYICMLMDETKQNEVSSDRAV